MPVYDLEYISEGLRCSSLTIVLGPLLLLVVVSGCCDGSFVHVTLDSVGVCRGVLVLLLLLVLVLLRRVVEFTLCVGFIEIAGEGGIPSLTNRLPVYRCTINI